MSPTFYDHFCFAEMYFIQILVICCKLQFVRRGTANLQQSSVPQSVGTMALL